MRALIFALASGVCLTGCSPADEVQEAPPAAPAAAQDAAVTDAGPPPCSTGRTLAVTQVCSDGDSRLFNAVNEGHPLFSPKCVWITEQLMLSETSFLVFRSQDCSAEGWSGVTYVHEAGKVKQGDATTPHAIDRVILEMFELKPGEEAHAFARTTLATAPEAERARCIIRPVEEGSPVPGAVFELAPDDAFMAELDARTEPWSACGDYGVAPEVRYWEPRNGFVFFHRLGQDLGYWDPASFTIYQPGADGVWRKAG